MNEGIKQKNKRNLIFVQYKGVSEVVYGVWQVILQVMNDSRQGKTMLSRNRAYPPFKDGALMYSYKLMIGTDMTRMSCDNVSSS